MMMMMIAIIEENKHDTVLVYDPGPQKWSIGTIQTDKDLCL